MSNEMTIALFHSEWDFQNEPLEEYLSHHGIRNQRWGVRNGPPYPLGRKTHNRIVKGKQDKELKRSDKQKHGITHVGHQDVGRRWKQVENFDEVRRSFVRDGQRFTRTFRGVGDVNLAELIGRGGDDEAAWRTLDRPGHRVTAEDLLDVNIQRRYNGPGAAVDGFLDPGLSNNCGMCSASLFLRGLGYDVQAGRADSGGVLNTAEEYWFDGAKTYKSKGAQALYQQMKAFGNQGKGTLSIRHKNGGGHAVYFQNERQSDGTIRPVIYDGQIAKKYSSLSEFLRAENADMTQFSRVTRLDGATPNWKHLAEDGVIRANFADETRKKVRDTKTGVTYYASKLRYSDDAFDKAHREQLEQYGTQGVDPESKPWMTLTNSYIRESQGYAERDKEAREYLKQKYGIGG